MASVSLSFRYPSITVPRLPLRLISLLWAVGLLAFLTSVASPNDDSLQQEVFHPRSSTVLVKRSLRLISSNRRLPSAAERLILASVKVPLSRTLCRVVPEDATPTLVRFQPLITLRSPPRIG